jgi:hypothetical protein
MKFLRFLRPAGRPSALGLRRGPSAFNDRFCVDIVIEETQLKSRVVLHDLGFATLLSAGAAGDHDGGTDSIGEFSTCPWETFASHG